MMPVVAPQPALGSVSGQGATGITPAVAPGESAQGGVFVDLLSLLITTAAGPCATASSQAIVATPDVTERPEAAEAMPPEENSSVSAVPPEYQTNLVALQLLLAAMAVPPASAAVSFPPAGPVSNDHGVPEGTDVAPADPEAVRTTVADRTEAPPWPAPEIQAAGQPPFEAGPEREAARPIGESLTANSRSPAAQLRAPGGPDPAEALPPETGVPLPVVVEKSRGVTDAPVAIRPSELSEDLRHPSDAAAARTTLRRGATPSDEPVVLMPRGYAVTEGGGETTRQVASPNRGADVRRAEVLVATLERRDEESAERVPEALAGAPLPAIARQEEPRDPTHDQGEFRQSPTPARREAPQGTERLDETIAARNITTPRMVAKADSATDALLEATVERVTSAVRASMARGGMEVHLRLHPESLGEVRVQVRWEGGTLSARLEAATPAARDALESGAPALRAALQEHGISLDRLSVHMRMDSDARSSHRYLAPETPMAEEPVPERAHRAEPIPIAGPVASARVDIRI